jgi:hypothetical protein
MSWLQLFSIYEIKNVAKLSFLYAVWRLLIAVKPLRNALSRGYNGRSVKLATNPNYLLYVAHSESELVKFQSSAAACAGNA